MRCLVGPVIWLELCLAGASTVISDFLKLYESRAGAGVVVAEIRDVSLVECGAACSISVQCTGSNYAPSDNTCTLLHSDDALGSVRVEEHTTYMLRLNENSTGEIMVTPAEEATVAPAEETTVMPPADPMVTRADEVTTDAIPTTAEPLSDPLTDPMTVTVGPGDSNDTDSAGKIIMFILQPSGPVVPNYYHRTFRKSW